MNCSFAEAAKVTADNALPSPGLSQSATGPVIWVAPPFLRCSSFLIQFGSWSIAALTPTKYRLAAIEWRYAEHVSERY